MNRFPQIGTVKPVMSSDVKRSRLGIGFEKLDREVFDPEKAYDKVAAIGVKWIRLQSGWARTEKTKGVYDFGWLDSVVDDLIRRGMQPWICLCYGNALYSPEAAEIFGAVGVPPIKTPAEREGWKNYVTALTRHFAGRVLWYEVWNEPDGSWCWKHGVNGAEYGEFVKATATAVKAGDPQAKVSGGSMCLKGLEWLNDVFSTGAGKVMDGLTYHAYDPNETFLSRVKALRAFCRLQNPQMEIIQGETGTQSRDDGAGALHRCAWTPELQAKFVARHITCHLLQDVKFTSYFSCMDMIEALNGKVGDTASYLDYGYFGVLGADFDANGKAVGTYTPKPSYYTLQTLAAVFREDFTVTDLPVELLQKPSPRANGNDTADIEILHGGFRRENGACAFAYWKPVDLLTASFNGTVTISAAGLAGTPRLVDLLTGKIHAIPESVMTDNGRGHIALENMPLRDYPLLLTFGDFF